LNEKNAPAYPAAIGFYDGASVLLEAVPAPGYQFAGWGGSVSGFENPLTVPVDCNKTIIARFSPKTSDPLLIILSGAGTSLFGLIAWLFARRDLIRQTP